MSKRGRESSSSEETSSSSDDSESSSSEYDDTSSEYDEASSSSDEDSANDSLSSEHNNYATGGKKPKSKRTKRDDPPYSSDSDEDDDKWLKDKKDGLKWDTLEHKGPVFSPPYEPLPNHVHFKYDGRNVNLSPATEEAAGYYARFYGHNYTKIDTFNENFFEDWQKLMTSSEKRKIKRLDKCDFSGIHAYLQQKAEERKAMSSADKAKIKRKKKEIQRRHGTCIVDGREVKVGNYSVEPPGLFIGRGDHPKMGMIKMRIQPEDVIINCGRRSKYPVPPKGHHWKLIQCDQTVTWLASWTENIHGKPKYIQLDQTSDLKREKDFQKYEIARELAKKIDTIRRNYSKGWNSQNFMTQECSVAMYFIDKFSFRAGSEKGKDRADTVGCCNLRCEHLTLYKKFEGKTKIVAFDFLGKDAIRYRNSVQVKEVVFNILKDLMKKKRPGDALFSQINACILNQHLSKLMDGLTAKVFRTYNASHVLQRQLEKLTPSLGTEEEKLLAYNRANRDVAILCNHQRTVPKNFEKNMENLRNKIKKKSEQIDQLERELRKMKKEDSKYQRKKEYLEKSRALLKKWRTMETDKNEGKQIALGTSKLNYMDPRITIAWCMKFKIPIEKVYNKTQRAKFHWAFGKASKNFKFD